MALSLLPGPSMLSLRIRSDLLLERTPHHSGTRRSAQHGRSYSFERILDDPILTSKSPDRPIKRKKTSKSPISNEKSKKSMQNSTSHRAVEQEREEQKGKIATLKSASVDPKIKKQLETLKLGKIRLPRQSREEYGTQRDLSGAGEIGTTPSTAYFPPSQCRLLAQASQAERFPLETAPEVCFAGRSNVGKSSLLNALIGAPLSKTSSKPGQTTNIRWYSNSNLISLVDLPGYGFSFATNAKSETWMGAVKEYLSNRKALKRCFVLLDARHPLKRIDESTMKFLEECKTTYQIVLTKADLVSVDDLAKRIQQTQVDLKRFPRAISDVLVVSAKNRSGLAPLRRQMISLFDPEMKRAFEAERDKKYLAAQRRREKRALKDEKTQQDKLMEQKRHSMRALAAHVRNQRRASL